ncbi:TIR-like domain-containing protein [Methyloglobulus morosus KoM1]|uniref:TIR-like domain-containing protein n=1 Tax=Methyloglobulus morosus KoM1 TaxID=1116472 RepID=V5C079_9GAMM|nr:TIR-like domain-containing protein [Methyloglobulus morosus KoM1]
MQQGHSNDLGIVESIDKGLAHSTQLLAVLSARTMGSWWVPYEIGCSRTQKAGIVYLMLPSLKPEMLPEYLRICLNLWTPEALFDWAKQFTRWPDKVIERYFSELRELEAGWPFGELGPGEEAFEEWAARAEIENRTFSRYNPEVDGTRCCLILPLQRHIYC